MNYKAGEEAICGMCNQWIVYVGPYWEHKGKLRPRHLAIPVAEWATITAEPDAPNETLNALGEMSHHLSGLVDRIRSAALEEAARLHENIDPKCDHESQGAGAMGAIIRYRDAIRKLKERRAASEPR